MPTAAGLRRRQARAHRVAARRRSACGFGFSPEDRKTEGIVADLSVRENIILALQAQRGWLRLIPRRRQDEIADRFIKLLDIRTPDAEKPIGLLSGGNQQKAILARWLATEPRFLILDEPTRGIDVGAHAEIIRLIERLCEDGHGALSSSRRSSRRSPPTATGSSCCATGGTCANCRDPRSVPIPS